MKRIKGLLTNTTFYGVLFYVLGFISACSTEGGIMNFSEKEPPKPSEVVKALRARTVSILVGTDIGCTGVIPFPGFVLTCFHCLHSDRDIQVEGKEAKVALADPKHDLVLLSVETPDISPITFASGVAVDETIIIVGNPQGLPRTVSRGRVVNILEDKGIFTDAHISHGSSGSGCWNERGELIGLLDSLYGDTDENFYFANHIIPAPVIARFLSK